MRFSPAEGTGISLSAGGIGAGVSNRSIGTGCPRTGPRIGRVIAGGPSCDERGALRARGTDIACGTGIAVGSGMTSGLLLDRSDSSYGMINCGGKLPSNG
jgi:hypothetical protein